MEQTGTPHRGTILCAQFEGRAGDSVRNRANLESALERASREHADLLVLPELANCGYDATREELFDAAEDAREGETVRQCARWARETGGWVVAGIAERAADSDTRIAYYDSAVLVGPEGLAHVYRKLHLFGNERERFAPGDGGLHVVETPVGRIGLLICYDLWFPEAARGLALQGAEIIALPTAWPVEPVQTDLPQPISITLSVATAHVNGVYLAAADVCGKDRETEFIGHSLVADPYGNLPAWCGWDAGWAVAPYDLAQVEGARRVSPVNHLLADRRPEFY